MARPRVSPSLAWTRRAWTRRASPFATPLASESSLMPVVNNWSRVLNSSTRQISGKTKCPAGYRVPASVPLVWLTRTPAIPLGTITMPAATSSGAQASIANASDVRQRSGGAGPGAPAAGSRFRRRRCQAISRYASQVRIPAAITNIATRAINSKYFSTSMVVLLSILWRVFGKLFRGFRAARERHADDLSEDEFFDQQRRGQREG